MKISIKYYVLRIMQMSFGLKVLLKLLVFLLLTTYYILHTTPAYAACAPGPSGVNIGDCFAFGEIKSLGDATTQLVMPAFSIATAAVVIYFLTGAFKYLKAGGSKEEVEGARQMITHAIIGFMVLMLAFFVLQFLLSSLFDTKFSIINL